MVFAEEIGQIYNSSETQITIEKLADEFGTALILSAYFSAPAFRWLSSVKNLNDVRLVVRATPADVVSGSCDLAAIRKAIAHGWKVRFIASLHAKVYLIGDCVVIGSANLTSNGMALHGLGNLELNTLVHATTEASALLNGIFEQAQEFDHHLLDRMEAHIKEQSLDKPNIGWWPEDIVSTEKRLLYCNDLPILRDPSTKEYENEPWTKIQEKIVCRDFAAALEALLSSYAYHWLKQKLLENDNELYFGAITSLLHDEIADDPSPYRSDIKSLLVNLLSLIESIDGVPIDISRPRHSQRIRLILEGS
ncbi:hypothetical protein G5B39_16130 (plasmid) [Rhodobacteraceae bacterium SC52]|nr:hypothetical protein G5B39_16130 [Rhodobacteraceae bacterium SC52]